MLRLETTSLNFISIGMRSNVTLFFGIIFSLVESLHTNIVQISILMGTAPIIWGMTSLIMPRLMSKFSLYQIILVAAWTLALSAVFRLFGGTFPLFFFTLTLNIGIGILNISIPAWVKQIAPNRTDLLLGRHYKIMLLASGCSIIMAVAILDTGNHWKWAFAPWLVPSLIGASLLIFVPERLTAQSAEVSVTKSYQSANGAGLSTFILFFGIQGVASHAFGVWSPSIMIDFGFSTLNSAIVCAMLTIVGAFLASKLLSQQLSQAALQKCFKIASLLLFVGYIQILSKQVLIFSLGLFLVFCSQGIIFLIGLISITRWSNDVSQVLAASSKIQGWGYVLTGFGPICVGLIRQSQGSWEACIYFMIFCTLGLYITGLKTLRSES